MKKVLTIFMGLAILLFFFVSADYAKGKKDPKPGKTIWEVPVDFSTIQDAMDSNSVLDGHTIRIGPGIYDGAIVTKAVEIKGTGNATIMDGPLLTTYMPCGTIVLNIGFFFIGRREKTYVLYP